MTRTHSPPVSASETPPRASDLESPLAFIWRHALAWRWSFLGLLGAAVAAASSGVLVQYCLKLLVDAMAKPPDQASRVWAILPLYVVLIAFESLLWRATGWLACRTTVGVGVGLRLELFRYLTGQPIRYFAERLAGSLGQRITATAGHLGALVNTATWRVIPPLTDFIGALLIFLFIDGRMSAALAALVCVFTTGLVVLGERGRPHHIAYAERAGSVAGELIDAINNMWAIKAFSAREREWKRLEARFEEEAEAQRRSWMYTEKTRIAYDGALWLMSAGMLAWALVLWSTNRISAGDVVVVSSLTFRILNGSRDVALAVVDIGQQLGYVAETLRVITRKLDLADTHDASPLQPRGGTVEFRDVSFAYDARGKGLRNINLTIQAGEKVGIVGPSGAGKSTLIHLIQRLYDPDKGEILIDGQPIRSVAQDSLREALAVVPQEITLFHRTLRENILFGRPEAHAGDLHRAAAAARCSDFAPAGEGFDALVGERGALLSGGQRQRIGIARALLKEALILVLDEATSALDTETEIAIHRNLIEHYPARTVIAVAHRLSTLAGFDRIIVVEDGEIADEGTAHELRQRNAFFGRMWKLQAEGVGREAA